MFGRETKLDISILNNQPHQGNMTSSFNRTIHPATLQKNVQKWFYEYDKKVLCVDLASIFPRSQADQGGAGLTSQINRGPTSQLTGLIQSVTNILLPDTTVHLHRSSEDQDSMEQSCFGGTRETWQVGY